MRLRVQKYTLFPYTTLFRSLKELILAYSFENHHHLISIQLNHLVYQIEHQLLKVIRSPSNQDLLKLPNDLVDSMYKIVLPTRSEEHTSELQSRGHLVCRLLL